MPKWPSLVYSQAGNSSPPRCWALPFFQQWHELTDQLCAEAAEQLFSSGLSALVYGLLLLVTCSTKHAAVLLSMHLHCRFNTVTGRKSH